MAMPMGMATPAIKSTYLMDVETSEALERLARRWRVSKSEALRRAIRTVAEREPAEPGEALRALDQLQRSLRLTAARTRAWTQAVRRER